MKRINIAFFLFTSLLSYSQKKETITVKKQGEIFFYRTGEFKDSLITKNRSDVFYLNISNDLKLTTEIKLSNATFLKTNDSNRFKLIYTKGMKYRLIYIAENSPTGDKTFETEISPDGATTSSSKDIEIELWDTKTNKRILKNNFVYSEK